VNLLYPVIPRAQLAAMVRIAAIGAVVAATYGAVHDQVSYTISPEYFTKLKFHQFAWADAGWPRRVFVAEVGMLATWWVGMIAGWVLCRAGFADPEKATLRGDVARAFAIVLGVAVASGVVGVLLGTIASHGDLTSWSEWRENLWLVDVPSFVIVAYLHWASYLGALLGLVVAVMDARRRRPTD
jgi:hypothetical protein